MFRGKERLASITTTMACHGRDVNVLYCSTRVLASRYGFQVVWAYAQRISTKVVDFQSCGNRSDEVSICPSIGKHAPYYVFLTSCGAKLRAGVTLPSGDRPTPDPAGRSLLDLRPKPLLFGQLGKQIETTVLPLSHVVIAAKTQPARVVRPLAALNRTQHDGRSGRSCERVTPSLPTGVMGRAPSTGKDGFVAVAYLAVHPPSIHELSEVA